MFVLAVYINIVCWCGPYLDPRKVSNVSTQIGPASVVKVTRETIQALVDSALDQKQVFNIVNRGVITSHNGKIIITGTLESILTFRSDIFLSTSLMWLSHLQIHFTYIKRPPHSLQCSYFSLIILPNSPSCLKYGFLSCRSCRFFR